MPGAAMCFKTRIFLLLIYLMSINSNAMDVVLNPITQDKNEVLQGIDEVAKLISESKVEPFIIDKERRKQFASVINGKHKKYNLDRNVIGIKTENSIYAINLASAVSAGAWNRIYAAHDLKTGELLIVRLRIYPLEKESERQFFRSLNILKDLGLFRDYLWMSGDKNGHLPMIFMKLVPGINLENCLDKLPKSLELRALIARAAYKAIEKLHNKGIYHGDIKLSNMNLDINDGEFVIRWVDFDESMSIKNAVPSCNYDMLPWEWNNKDPLERSVEYFRLGTSMVQLLSGKIVTSKTFCKHKDENIYLCRDCADKRFKDEFSMIYKKSDLPLYENMREVSLGLCQVKLEERVYYKDVARYLKQFDKKRKKTKFAN